MPWKLQVCWRNRLHVQPPPCDCKFQAHQPYQGPWPYINE